MPLHDVKTAIRFFKENAADFKIDPEKIVVFGESAGGHLAQLIAATSDLKEHYYEGIPQNQLESAPSTSVAAVVSFYTPSEPHMLVQDRAAFARGEAYDTSMEPENKLMGGTYPGEEGTVVATAWRMSAPYTLARRATPDGERRWAPTFLAHGTADVVVPLAQSERVRAALETRGIEHEMVRVNGADHAVPAIYQDNDLLNQMLSFVKSVLG